MHVLFLFHPVVIWIYPHVYSLSFLYPLFNQALRSFQVCLWLKLALKPLQHTCVSTCGDADAANVPKACTPGVPPLLQLC